MHVKILGRVSKPHQSMRLLKPHEPTTDPYKISVRCVCMCTVCMTTETDFHIDNIGVAH